MFIQGSIGNDLWHAARSGQEFWHFVNNRSVRILDAWTPENTDATIPQVNANNPFSESTRPSTYFIEDGSYLRLKSLHRFSDSLLPGFGGVPGLTHEASGKELPHVVVVPSRLLTPATDAAPPLGVSLQ